MNKKSDDVRFLVRLPQTYCPANPEALLTIAAAAEEMGFWGVSVQDHLIADEGVTVCGDDHDDHGDDRVVYETLQTLAFVGARTEKVKLVAGVLITPFRHAVVLAKEIASLDVFTGGRLIVGTGVGAPVHGKSTAEGGQNMAGHSNIARLEFEAYGIPGQFGKRANESLQVMEAIFADEPATFHGEFYNFEGLDVHPKPKQRPRPVFWVGGRSEAARIRAMTLGDGWVPSQMTPDAYGEYMEWMRGYATENNLEVPHDLGFNIFASIDADGDKARYVNQRTFGHRFEPGWLEQCTLGGNPDEFIKQTRAFTDAGANVVDLKLIPPTVEENIKQMRLVADEVMPAFA